MVVGMKQMIMDLDIHEAWSEGYAAAQSEQQKTGNPYPDNPTKGKAWNEGWDDFQEDEREN